jgi:hypothetical protein
MDSRQIAKILNRNVYTKGCFKGVFSADNIRLNSDDRPYGLVANTDSKGKPGTHWVAFYFPNHRTVEYFDSLGQIPNEHIKKILDQFSKVKLNKHKVQAMYETSCGPHAIYFLMHRCAGNSFDSILKSLNHPFSDTHVKIFLTKLLNSY